MSLSGLLESLKNDSPQRRGDAEKRQSMLLSTKKRRCEFIRTVVPKYAFVV